MSEPLHERGHIAHAMRIGGVANRSLVRDVVHALLRDADSVVYIVYDTTRHKLVVRAQKPVWGSWRSIGPVPRPVTLDDLAEEIDALALAVRREARESTG